MRHPAGQPSRKALHYSSSPPRFEHGGFFFALIRAGQKAAELLDSSSQPRFCMAGFLFAG
jgi:hypothetical protein